MILNEIYKKKQTLYYHGSDKSFDKLEPQEVSGSSHKVAYITKNSYYAYKNFLKDDGFIYVCKITKPLNIFNACSKIDLFRLKKGMNLSGDEILSLQLQDWLIFDIIKGRNISGKGELIDRVFSLGYDGFYNNENSGGWYSLDGIGLFSKDSIEIVKKYTKEEAENFIRGLKRKLEHEKATKLLDEYHRKNGITDDMMKKLAEMDRRKLERLSESEWKSLLTSIGFQVTPNA